MLQYCLQGYNCVLFHLKMVSSCRDPRKITNSQQNTRKTCFRYEMGWELSKSINFDVNQRGYVGRPRKSWFWRTNLRTSMKNRFFFWLGSRAGVIQFPERSQNLVGWPGPAVRPALPIQPAGWAAWPRGPPPRTRPNNHPHYS